VVVLFPLWWLIVTSLKSPAQVDKGPFYIPFVDFQPTLDAWRYILVELGNDTLRPYVNTVVVGLTSSVIALTLGSAAAYALVRFNYRPRVGVIGLFIGCIVYVFVGTALGAPFALMLASGFAIFLILYATVARRFRRSLGNGDVAFWLISQRILPPVAVVIPIYVMFQRLGLLDTWQALIITYVTIQLPLVIWILEGFFRELPNQVVEAAQIDGLGPVGVFVRIGIPLSMPAVSVAASLAFIAGWNEFIFALALTRTPDAQTVPVGLASGWVYLPGFLTAPEVSRCASDWMADRLRARRPGT